MLKFFKSSFLLTTGSVCALYSFQKIFPSDDRPDYIKAIIKGLRVGISGLKILKIYHQVS